MLHVDGTAVYTTGYNAGQDDIILDAIVTLYSGVNTSSDHTLTCTQGSATNSITKSVQNSSGNFRDVLYDAYVDIPAYKYDDTGYLYILKSVQHYMKGSTSTNWPTDSWNACFLHSIEVTDENGKPLSGMNDYVCDNTTGTTFNYIHTVSPPDLHCFTTSTVRVRVLTKLRFDMISGNSGIFTQTGTARNNDYITATYLKQKYLLEGPNK